MIGADYVGIGGDFDGVNRRQPEKMIPFKGLCVGDKTDVGIQTSQTPQAIVYPDSKKLSLKKCRNTVSSTENKSPTTITTEAIVQTSPKKISNIVLNKQRSLASEESSPKQKVPTSKFRKEDSTKYDLYRRKRSDSSDSLILVVMPKGTDVKSTKSKLKQVTKSKRNARRKSMSASSSEKLQPKLKKWKRSASDAVIKDEDVEKILANISTTSDDEDSIAIKSKTKSINKSLNDTQSTDNLRELNMPESDVEVLRNYLINTRPDFDLLRFDADDNYRVQFFYTINPLVNVERCSKLTRILRRDSQEEVIVKDFASQLGLKSISETSAPQCYKMRNTKERRNLNRTCDVSDSEIIKKQKVGKGNNSRSDISDSDFEDKDERRKKKSYKKNHKSKTLRSNKNSLQSEPKALKSAKKDEINEDKINEQNVSTNKNADDKAKSSKKISVLNQSKKNDSGSEYNSSRKNYISENTNETSTVKNSRNSKKKLYTTSTNTKEKVQNKVSYDTIETINLSSNSEDEVLTKKTLTEKIEALTPNQNRPGSSTSSHMREVPYSSLEDYAIVSWVSCGDRAHCVHGNRIWQQLQEHFCISGKHRTWHSLRNRYLNHILPGLRLLWLDPSQVSRLCAAAATGEIKSRNEIPDRRNSIVGAVTSGALSRQPRAEFSSESDNEFAMPAKRHKHDGRTKSPPPTTRVLNFSLPTSSDEKTAHSPRYSDITRKFAAKHRYEYTSPSKEKQSPERDSNKKHSLVRDSPRDKNNSPDREISTKNSNKAGKNRSSPEKEKREKVLCKITRRKSLSDKCDSSAEFTKAPSINLRRKSMKESVRDLNEDSRSKEKDRGKGRKLFNPKTL